MENLTTAQYDRLRNLIRRSPVFSGRRVVVHDDHVEILEPEELVLAFGPVFDAVDGAPMSDWADLVDERLERMIQALVAGSPELDGPTEHLLDRIYARVRPIEGSPVEWWTYAREIAPGLLVVLALDHPDRIAILNDDQVRRHDFDRLVEAGMENLCHQLPEEYATFEGVYVLRGNDYVASTVLVMPWVIEAVTGAAEFPYGALVAMPNHGTLIFHVLRDAAAARGAMREIAEIAAEYYEESAMSGPDQVSRQVYWWEPGAGYLEPVAHHAVNGTGVIGDNLVTGFSREFADLLDAL
ncbi:hypothetical protein [Amycolatopsis albispora]|uniref:Uncharacterized protein n=1 Tax=Amycolatopsis albispora TaxID=1804986 RepID=A0A344L2M8_9PSEU|nr:hypothetical protein [Amycolatopsis albispora]AXB42302.1 hypothetical protein A4R43_06970 [Amycolatopsis albispora]